MFEFLLLDAYAFGADHMIVIFKLVAWSEPSPHFSLYSARVPGQDKHQNIRSGRIVPNRRSRVAVVII